jgi:hypothetical protein
MYMYIYMHVPTTLTSDHFGRLVEFFLCRLEVIFGAGVGTLLMLPQQWYNSNPLEASCGIGISMYGGVVCIDSLYYMHE